MKKRKENKYSIKIAYLFFNACSHYGAKKTEGNNYIKMAITSLFFFKVVIVTSEE